MVKVVLGIFCLLTCVNGEDFHGCKSCFQTEMNKIEERMANGLDAMEKKMEAKTYEMDKIIKNQQTVIEDLQMLVENLRDPPIAYMCSFQSSAANVNSETVTYDSIIY